VHNPVRQGTQAWGQAGVNVKVNVFHWTSQTLLKNSRYIQPYGACLCYKGCVQVQGASNCTHGVRQCMKCFVFACVKRGGRGGWGVYQCPPVPQGPPPRTCCWKASWNWSANPVVGSSSKADPRAAPPALGVASDETLSASWLARSLDTPQVFQSTYPCRARHAYGGGGGFRGRGEGRWKRGAWRQGRGGEGGGAFSPIDPPLHITHTSTSRPRTCAAHCPCPSPECGCG
jgi:hypothetical protein